MNPCVPEGDAFGPRDLSSEGSSNRRLAAAQADGKSVGYTFRLRDRTPEQPKNRLLLRAAGRRAPRLAIPKTAPGVLREPGSEPRLAATQTPANRLAIPTGSATGRASVPTYNSSVRVAETLVRVFTVNASANPRTIGGRLALDCSSAGPRHHIEPLAAETAVPRNAAELGHQRVQQAAVLGGHDILREAAGTARFLGRRAGLVDGCQIVILSLLSRIPLASPACEWC